MCISERPFAHLVKTLTVSDIDYKYFDITSIDRGYGMFPLLLVVVVNVAFNFVQFVFEIVQFVFVVTVAESETLLIYLLQIHNISLHFRS